VGHAVNEIDELRQQIKNLSRTRVVRTERNLADW